MSNDRLTRLFVLVRVFVSLVLMTMPLVACMVVPQSEWQAAATTSAAPSQQGYSTPSMWVLN